MQVIFLAIFAKSTQSLLSLLLIMITPGGIYASYSGSYDAVDDVLIISALLVAPLLEFLVQYIFIRAGFIVKSIPEYIVIVASALFVCLTHGLTYFSLAFWPSFILFGFIIGKGINSHNGTRYFMIAVMSHFLMNLFSIVVGAVARN